jgi:hypothetical protein
MTTSARPPDGRDDDGVRIAKIASGRRWFWLVVPLIALPVVATVVAVAIIRAAPNEPARRPVPAAEPDVVAQLDVPPPAPAAPAAPVATPAGRVVPRRIAKPLVVDDRPVGIGASPVPAPQKPRREIDAADAIVALREEGIHEGIAAFGLPGSHPPKSGILVPEEFELPEGYVRHYQSTDDGEQLPAILMFHPDYEFVNERGEVVKVPDDLVVPPDMAPPGLNTDDVLDVPERKGGEPVH